MKGSLLVAGTTSDAGKSVVTTGLCRLLARRGVRVAPFKAQNMSNNSMVVAGPDGLGAEIGRAQWIQAVAAGATPEVAMNPVLLKPGSDRRSHVILNGHPAGLISSAEFAGSRGSLAKAAFAAYDDLVCRFDVVVCEGAGSPTEINLREHDYINMGLARHADMPVIVVGDIDRGGVYAALHGTVALLQPADQRLVAGFVVNKFRGDETLLEPANREIERITGRPVLGVIPWSPAVWLDSEDGLDLAGRAADAEHPLVVAVVRFPRISNFTDLDALGLEPDVDVRFASRPQDLADADLVVLPGTRATIADLAWLRHRGLDRAVVTHAAAGRPVLGICGGFQMLGRTISDPDGVEGAAGTVVEGLGLLDTTTTFAREKVLRLSQGTALGAAVSGYEIHHGVTTTGGEEEFFGGARRQHVLGTMVHGSLESDGFRHALLGEVAARVGRPHTASGVSFEAARQARLDLLADLVEGCVDMDAIDALITRGAPGGLPALPPGDSR
ncbi:cobyric acid synthase [Phycicoccus sp. Soil803]|uniref:cobyric acid synthase n=1 Tax=Phycicoccus sp. Soil803 TaxID=1736415 RepID=UPI000709A4BA|nr:cobyric acid synthase [Phycicoccus sp. Soil803]KRF25079.1 cobalamin biosynthesis protein CobQ [Phycicoccus sp. Soil803]